MQCNASVLLTLSPRAADAPLTTVQAMRLLILQPFLMTTIPQKYEDPAECVPGSYMACMLPAGMKAALLTQPSFPHAVPTPSVLAYRVAAVAEGVMCTNMIRIEKIKLKVLVPDIPDDEKILHFSAVCEMLSCLNHSCHPNASIHFNPLSFSFKLHAVRPIPAGAEITVTYIQLIVPTTTCQAKLVHFSFTCTCTACSDPRASDKCRAELEAMPCHTPTEMFAWLLRSGRCMPADFLTHPNAHVLMLAEEEGVQDADLYTMHLEQLCIAYGMLGQHKEYLRACAQFMLLEQGAPERMRHSPLEFDGIIKSGSW
ncbi:hypothetical protein EWM64_g9722 [Hericium alpestre]|uniref:SET domain-containing protein n=1 Tax=Hericium alpestre TaxID=135208 RepID=A0A4Y9ZJD7_9AGAM|nr:hypothetical protein EWM64_g9722 [Hericium alpestre]